MWAVVAREVRSSPVRRTLGAARRVLEARELSVLLALPPLGLAAHAHARAEARPATGDRHGRRRAAQRCRGTALREPLRQRGAARREAVALREAGGGGSCWRAAGCWRCGWARRASLAATEVRWAVRHRLATERRRGGGGGEQGVSRDLDATCSRLPDQPLGGQPNIPTERPAFSNRWPASRRMESEYHIAPQPVRGDAAALRQPRAAKPDARIKPERAPSATRERGGHPATDPYATQGSNPGLADMVPGRHGLLQTYMSVLTRLSLAFDRTCKNCLVPVKLCHCSASRAPRGCARCVELEQELGAERC